MANEDGGNQQRGNDPSQLEEAAESVFGLNFRSFRTVYDIFVRPNQIFRTYAEGNFSTYTPALRIWLGLIGIQVAIAAFFGGWEGIIRQQLERSDPQVLEQYRQITGGDIEVFFGHYASAVSIGQPIFIGLFSALVVFLPGLFRKGMPFARRLNIAMAVLTSGSVIGLSLFLVIFIDSIPQWVVYLTTAPVVLMYFITYFRGAPGVLADTASGAFLKAVYMAISLLALVLIGYVVLSLVATLYGLQMMS